MKAARTHDSRHIDYAATINGRVMLGNMLVMFIRGIKGPRQSPVSLKQITTWFRGTDASFVETVLDELISAERVTIVRNSLRYGNNSKQAYYYDVL
jgi:hypothetical protein